MPNYRRAYVPGGTFFFTVVTYQRRYIFHEVWAQSILGDTLRDCQKNWPFEINAIVLLPDHLHTIWTLPRGDTNYSARWSSIKKEFTKKYLAQGGQEAMVTQGNKNEHRRGVWQRRFWEHVIQDEEQFEAYFDYIHYNPVKHKFCNCPAEWHASTFHKYVAQKVYPHNWCCSFLPKPNFTKIESTIGE